MSDIESVIRDWWYSSSRVRALTSREAATGLQEAIEAGGYYIRKNIINRVENADNLEGYLANTIDVWHAAHPNLTVQEILSALESVRHKLTEGLLGDQIQ